MCCPTLYGFADVIHTHEQSLKFLESCSFWAWNRKLDTYHKIINLNLLGSQENAAPLTTDSSSNVQDLLWVCQKIQWVFSPAQVGSDSLPAVFPELILPYPQPYVPLLHTWGILPNFKTVSLELLKLKGPREKGRIPIFHKQFGTSDLIV